MQKLHHKNNGAIQKLRKYNQSFWTTYPSTPNKQTQQIKKGYLPYKHNHLTKEPSIYYVIKNLAFFYPTHPVCNQTLMKKESIFML